MVLSDESLSAARERLVTIPDDATLLDAAGRLSAGIDLIAVCNSANTLVGVISKTDVVSHISVGGEISGTAASSVMSRDLVVCRAMDSVEEISKLLRDRGLKNLPIVDDSGRPVGLLTARDMLRSLLLNAEYDEAQLIDYVKGVGYR